MSNQQKNNSDRRDGYDAKKYEENFERVFGTDKERKQRADAVRVEEHKHSAAANKSAYIMKSIDPFKSMVDGSIISDHKQLREHNKRNGVTNSADYSADFMDKRRTSIGDANERTAKIERVEALKQTMRTKGYE